MANKRFYQFLYSKQPKLTMITGAFTVADGGAVASGSVVGAGVYSITQASTGTYQIKLVDNYYSGLSAEFQAYQPPGAASTNVSALVGSSAYQISVVGNSTWSTVGVDTDYTAVVGMPFIATAVAGSGTGTAKLLGPSKINSFEVLGKESPLLQNINPNQGRGSSLLFATMRDTVATTYGVGSTTLSSVVTSAPANPIGSTSITFKLWYRDSSALP